MALPALCVEEAVADELVACLKQFAAERKMGPAWTPATELGPLFLPTKRSG